MMPLDRVDAGCRLGGALLARVLPEPIVIGVWRDGAPVAASVARVLHAPFEICIVRELFAPGSPGRAFGAVAEHGGSFLDEAAIEELGIEALHVAHAVSVARSEVARLGALLREDAPLAVTGHHAILVDDSLTTISAVRAGSRALRAQGPASLTLAVPVASCELLSRLRFDFDRVVYLGTASA